MSTGPSPSARFTFASRKPSTAARSALAGPLPALDRPRPPILPPVSIVGLKRKQPDDYHERRAFVQVPSVAPSPSSYQPPTTSPLAFAVPGSYDAQVTNDLQLWFPKAGLSPLALWTSTTLLAAVSPYYKIMFSSGFSESRVMSINGDQSTDVLALSANFPAELHSSNKDAGSDSDLELDQVWQTNPTKSAVSTSARRITVTQASYTTYKALLSWLHTGQIIFAPLTAAFATPAARQSHSRIQLNLEPHRPLPCSSKSMYKLAHLLDIPSLARIALDAYIHQVEPRFAHKEVFSAMLLYDDVKARLVQYAQANKAAIKEAGGSAKVTAALAKGELDGVEREVSQVLAGLV